jgi:hypothetical protein
MRHRFGNAIPAWTLGLVVLGLTAAAAQEQTPRKYLLKEAPAAVGDVSVLERSDGFKMDVYGKPRDIEGAVPQSLPITRRGREKFSETVLAIDKDGASHVRRTYTIARRQDTVKPGGPVKIVVAGRQGKTITLLRKGGKVIVAAAKGKLTAPEIKNLQTQFKPGSDIKTFPDHEIAIGDEWTIENAEAAKRQGLKSLILKCRLVELVPFQGRECAHVAVEMNMEADQNGFPLTWAMKGDLYHALDLQRSLSLKLSGPVEMKGSVKSNDLTIDLEGFGTGDFSLTQVWSKIAGKPLPPAKAASPAQ